MAGARAVRPTPVYAAPGRRWLRFSDKGGAAELFPVHKAPARTPAVRPLPHAGPRRRATARPAEAIPVRVGRSGAVASSPNHS